MRHASHGTKLIDYNEFCGIRGGGKVCGGGVPEIQVEELKRRLDNKDDLFVLDVREPHQYQICNLGGYLIPLNDLPKRVNELDSSREIVVHCKMGGRSAKAVAFLQQAGFTKVHNLSGRYRLVGSRGSEGAEVLKALLDRRCQLKPRSREKGSTRVLPLLLYRRILLARTGLHAIAGLAEFEGEFLALEAGSGEGCRPVAVLLQQGGIVTRGHSRSTIFAGTFVTTSLPCTMLTSTLGPLPSHSSL